jgi:hypothetical protein
MRLPRKRDSHGSRAYDLNGDILESCSCWAPCPCWIGADPDGDSCLGFNAYHIESGSIDGVDVSGSDFVRVFDIRGNPRVPGSWREYILVDSDATDRQAAAIVEAYSGALGGPLADLALLVAERLGPLRASISFDVREGSGTVRAGHFVSVSVKPFRGGDGRVTTLCNSMMASSPRAPAYVASAEVHTVALREAGFDWTFRGRSAIQSAYRVVHEP